MFSFPFFRKKKKKIYIFGIYWSVFNYIFISTTNSKQKKSSKKSHHISIVSYDNILVLENRTNVVLMHLKHLKREKKNRWKCFEKKNFIFYLGLLKIQKVSLFSVNFHEFCLSFCYRFVFVVSK